MARLPVPGGDSGDWGSILNDFLDQAHNADGSLKNNAVDTAAIQNNSVVGSKIIDATITESKLASGVVAKLNQPVPVTSVNTQTGDVTLTKSSVGLGNVDNTSDDDKPISTATQSALNSKANQSITVTGATSLTGGGNLSANRSLSLVNDSATPGNSKYYGTNASGVKGYHDISSGSSDPTVGGDLSGTASNAQIVANAVDTTELADGAVTNAKVASGIAQSKIQNLATDLAAKQSTSTLTTKGDMYIATGSATVTRLPAGTNGQIMVADSSTATGMRWTTPPITKLLPYSYLGILATGPGTFRLYNDTASDWTIVGTRASVGTAPSGSSIIVDVNKNGTSIFTNQANRPTIAAGSNTSGNVTNMNVTTIAVNDYLTVDVDQVGSGTAGTDLMIQVEVF